MPVGGGGTRGGIGERSSPSFRHCVLLVTCVCRGRKSLWGLKKLIYCRICRFNCCFDIEKVLWEVRALALASLAGTGEPA